jgi:hypothetical protein
MKKRFIPIGLILALFSAGMAQENLFTILAKAGNRSDFPDAPYLVIEDRTEVRVTETGLAHMEKTVFYKVLTEDGARELKAPTFGYDPQSAAIEVRELKVIRRNGREEIVPLSLVTDYPAPARMIYWGAREKMIPLPRLEPGDGLRVKTAQKGFTYALLRDRDEEKYVPPMKGHFYDIVPFYSTVPVLLKSYRLDLPASKTLQFEFYNGEARHYVRFAGDRTLYFWEKKEMRPVTHEPDMVDPSDVAPKLLLSTSPDWKAKSLWFWKVNEDYGSFEYDRDISEKVSEIVRGARDDREKISRLTHWVAEEIRYSGISMGEGEGYTLHKGTMTFRDRCGVCKDKAGMLVTMLRAAGFSSYPAMTMAGSRIERIPADQFNHCVTLVKVGNEYRLLDPTWVPGVRELWSSAEQQQEYLMGVPEGMDLKTTLLSPPENHYLRYVIDSAVESDGTLTGTFLIQAEGQSDSGLRRSFTRSPIHLWPKELEKEFFRLHPDLRVDHLTFVDPYDLSRPMEIRFHFEIPRYFTRWGDSACVRPVSASLPFQSVIAFSRIDTSPDKRSFPFRVRSSQRVELRETLRMPSGWKLSGSPELETVTGSGASFSGKVEQKGTVVSIREKLDLKKRIYPVEDWESFRASVREFKKAAEKPFLFSRGESR